MGIGDTVVEANGETVKIGSWQDIVAMGATCHALHWNYHGAMARVDDRTGR